MTRITNHHRNPDPGGLFMQRFFVAAIAIAMAACTTAVPPAPTPMPTPEPVAVTSGNPLLAPWPGPHGGVPAFDRIEVAHFKPALEAAMAENLAKVERIAGATEPATFENKIGRAHV